MVFNSFEFAAFMAVVLPLFLLLRRWVLGRNLFLLGVSYFFYGWWDWRFLGLIALSTVIDYVVGLGFAGQEVGAPRKGRREKALLWASCVSNLGILGLFKYHDFFVGSVEGALGGIGIDAQTCAIGAGGVDRGAGQTAEIGDLGGHAERRMHEDAG